VYKKSCGDFSTAFTYGNKDISPIYSGPYPPLLLSPSLYAYEVSWRIRIERSWPYSI